MPMPALSLSGYSLEQNVCHYMAPFDIKFCSMRGLIHLFQKVGHISAIAIKSLVFITLAIHLGHQGQWSDFSLLQALSQQLTPERIKS